MPMHSRARNVSAGLVVGAFIEIIIISTMNVVAIIGAVINIVVIRAIMEVAIRLPMIGILLMRLSLLMRLYVALS